MPTSARGGGQRTAETLPAAASGRSRPWWRDKDRLRMIRRTRAWLGAAVGARVIFYVVWLWWRQLPAREWLGPGQVSRMPWGQEGACDGLPQTEILVRLTTPEILTSATFCLPDGHRSVVTDAVQLQTSSRALSGKDRIAWFPRNCSAVGETVPAFVIDVDGRRMRPAVPLGRARDPI